MAKHHRKTNPESEPLTRGFKKKARTRQTLVDAAIRIYAEKGVGALLLNELAERAGVSAFMTKPFSNAEMLEQVRALMAETS